MNCVVTGGAGFIGSHVVDELIRLGHDVLVIDDLSGGYEGNIHPSARLLQVAVEDLPRGALDGIDVVFHLAAFAAEGLSVFAPTTSALRNTVGFSRVLAEAVQSGVTRFVFTSSMAVYGANPELPFKESHGVNPADPYGVAKVASEDLLRIYEKEYGLTFTILRPHNVYGPRQNLGDPYRNVIGIFMRELLAGRPLKVFGDGKQHRAFTYIEDLAPCVVHAAFLRSAENKTLNIGGQTPSSILDLIDELTGICGRSIAVEHVPARLGDVRMAYSDSTQAQEILGFRDSTSLHNGLERMYEWAKEVPLIKVRHRHDWIEITRGMPAHWMCEG